MNHRKQYTGHRIAPLAGPGNAFALLDVNGNIVRGLGESTFVPKNAGGLVIENGANFLHITNPDTDLCTVLIDNGRCGISMDDRVSVDALGVLDCEITSLFVNDVTYETHQYANGQSIDVAANGMLCIIGNGSEDCTVTLPSPALGKSVILSGFSSYTAPFVERVTPAFASHIRYVNSSNNEVTVAAGAYFSVKGRCVQLVGVSNIQWQLVGGYL